MTGTLFNTASHIFDLLIRLNGDQPVRWVQAHLPNGDGAMEGNRLVEDPIGHGMIQFENGVMGYALNSGRGLEVEAIGEDGVVTALGTDREWQVREPGDRDHRGRNVLVEGVFPEFERRSSTLRLVEDLVNGLDEGKGTRCGVRLARANNEVIFGFVESHVRGGARVEMPLGESEYYLKREGKARVPKFER